MGQPILPLFIEGETSINRKIHYEYDKSDNTIYYYLFCHPLFSHSRSDDVSFFLMIAQLIIHGHCKNVEIVKAFGVTPISVKRAVKKFRNGGPPSFFKNRATRGPNVMTPEVITEAQKLLDDGENRSQVAEELGLRVNTLSKAIQAGKLTEKKRVDSK